MKPKTTTQKDAKDGDDDDDDDLVDLRHLQVNNPNPNHTHDVNFNRVLCSVTSWNLFERNCTHTPTKQWFSFKLQRTIQNVLTYTRKRSELYEFLVDI